MRRAPSAPTGAKAKVGGAAERAARKTMSRIDRQLKRISSREAALSDEMALHVADHEKLAALSAEAQDLAAERAQLEAEWLEAVTLLE